MDKIHLKFWVQVSQNTFLRKKKPFHTVRYDLVPNIKNLSKATIEGYEIEYGVESKLQLTANDAKGNSSYEKFILKKFDANKIYKGGVVAPIRFSYDLVYENFEKFKMSAISVTFRASEVTQTFYFPLEQCLVFEDDVVQEKDFYSDKERGIEFSLERIAMDKKIIKFVVGKQEYLQNDSWLNSLKFKLMHGDPITILGLILAILGTSATFYFGCSTPPTISNIQKNKQEINIENVGNNSNIEIKVTSENTVASQTLKENNRKLNDLKQNNERMFKEAKKDRERLHKELLAYIRNASQNRLFWKQLEKRYPIGFKLFGFDGSKRTVELEDPGKNLAFLWGKAQIAGVSSDSVWISMPDLIINGKNYRGSEIPLQVPLKQGARVIGMFLPNCNLLIEVLGIKGDKVLCVMGGVKVDKQIPIRELSKGKIDPKPIALGEIKKQLKAKMEANLGKGKSE